MTDSTAKTNGPMEGEKLLQDPDDPEYQKQKIRPADIDQDMKEMDRRKRVEMILNSNIFREELERIVEVQLREGYSPASLLALQQISELIVPGSTRFNGANALKGSVIPIADIRGVDSFSYAKGEKLLRCKLASVYRLIDMFGWSEGIYNHVTVRVSQDQEHFLINPFGLLYHEVTASSLVKVDMQGGIVEAGSTNYGINVAGFTLHSAVHTARPDIRAVVHIHLPTVIAVSACQQGLLPLCMEAVLIGEVSTHDYQGITVDSAERESIARDLGPVNKVMLLRNHGIVCCGETLEEAFYNAWLSVKACEAQVRAMSLGLDKMVLVPDELAKKYYEAHVRGAGSSKQESGDSKDPSNRKWKLGELEFEAYMRMLDNAGYRTGYIYKQPLQRSEAPKARSDVEVPPAATSSTYIFDEDDLLRFSPLKRILDGRRVQDKSRWLNSPNVYQKVEVLETGTNDPKKITKWVADGSPTHGTAVKLEGAHTFIPPGTDPQEFKKKQKELKEVRMQSKVSAGPQSHILEGVSWDEVKKLQDASMSGTGDQVVVVGAASKGIIQRDYQHNAMVYKMPYAKNPFDSITDEELEEYKRIVEKKQRGEPIEDEQQERMLMTEAKLESAQLMQMDGRSPQQSPTSPLSEEEARRQVYAPTINTPPVTPTSALQRSNSERMKEQASRADDVNARLPRRYFSTREGKPKGETAVNGDDIKGLRSESADNISAASRSSKEGSPIKEEPQGESPKKDKKKKKGLRTPSFLKKKKDKKKEEVAK